MRIINEAVLDRFRGPGVCEWCKKPVRNREPHHLFCRGMGGGGRLDVAINLMALCSAFSGGDDCHAAVHAGSIPRCSLLAVVAAREQMLQADVENELNRMKWAKKGAGR